MTLEEIGTAGSPGPELMAAAGAYAVKLPVFEGPLDLLLHLIRQDEVEITEIPIALIGEKLDGTGIVDLNQEPEERAPGFRPRQGKQALDQRDGPDAPTGRAQTHQTLDIIAALIGRENFARHGLRGTGATLADLAHIRVYVKHAADYEKVLAICRRRVGELPAVYAVADVCRPELLVEIEGVAYAARLSVS